MRATLTYTAARILLYAGVLGVLYLAGARGLLLVAMALLVSGLVSFVVLSRQRDAMSGALVTRLHGARARMSEFGRRIDEGTRAEDED